MARKKLNARHHQRKPQKIDWLALEAPVRAAHANGATSAEVASLVYGLGVRMSPQTLWNHMARSWGLYFRHPRVREPWSNEHVTKARRDKNAQPCKVSEFIGPPESQVSRLCERPTDGPYTTLTALLMGDPRPGRTPWAA
jgi:hypothetical protein